MGRMKKTSKEYCITCKYHIGGDTEKSTSRIACQYILKTGNRRGCPVGVCDKYEKKIKPEKEVIPWEEETYLNSDEQSYLKPIRKMKTLGNM